MNYKLSWSLLIDDALIKFITVFKVFDEYWLYDLYLNYCLEIRTNDSL